MKKIVIGSIVMVSVAGYMVNVLNFSQNYSPLELEYLMAGNILAYTDGDGDDPNQWTTKTHDLAVKFSQTDKGSKWTYKASGLGFSAEASGGGEASSTSSFDFTCTWQQCLPTPDQEICTPVSPTVCATLANEVLETLNSGIEDEEDDEDDEKEDKDKNKKRH